MADIQQQILAKLEQLFQVAEATRKYGTTINNPAVAVAAATTQPPTDSTPGVVTRNIPSGNQQVSITNLPPNLSNDNVIVTNFPAVQSVNVNNFPVSQNVVVGNFPPVQAVSVNNFPATQPVSVSNFPATQAISGSVSVSNLPAVQSVNVNNFPASVAVNVNNFPATQPVSGSVSVSNLPAVQSVNVNNFPATQPVSGTVAVSNFPASVAVSNFPAVQATREVINAGRQQVFLSWENIAGTTAETLAAFTSGSRNGAALPAATSYAVSAGKTLRIQSLVFVFGQNGSSACNYRARIRQSASVNAASPIIAAAGAGGPSNTCNVVSVTIADNLEIAAGQQIGLSHIDTTTGGIFSAYMIGFEY